MTGPVHIVRNSLADKERTFTLGPEALHWSDARGAGQMAYEDVRDLRLLSYASPIGQSFQCTVRSRKGTKIKLRSTHYRSLNNFEDRTTTYAPFVRAFPNALRSMRHRPGSSLAVRHCGLFGWWSASFLSG